MAHYVEFDARETGATVLMEVDAVEVEESDGVEKAGLDWLKKSGKNTVAKAHVRFDVAIKRVVDENVRALTEAVQKLTAPPDQIELAFGLKATGEAGNIAVGKMGGEANFELRLVWKTPDRFSGNLSVADEREP